MILSAQSIRHRGIVHPFYEGCKYMGMSYGLQPAGYDIRIKEPVVLAPYGFTLASALEELRMPTDIMAMVADKSTWARRGIALQSTWVQPGWRGHLTLEISNHGPDEISIEFGMPIAQLIFFKVDHPTDIPYNGRYQDQKPEPVAAK